MSSLLADHPVAEAPERDERLVLPDGRTLSYALLGAATGPAVVVLDGPGSRGLARAAAPVAAELGLRLVAPDRPGAGESTPAPALGIADWPGDHGTLLDAIGAPSAGILGQSGGTPYALAAAAALPERTIAVALTGALAPLDDPQSLAEAGRELRGAVRLARRAPWLLRLVLRSTARRTRRDPDRAARKLLGDPPPADAAVLEDPGLFAMHVRTTTEVLARPAALAHELRLFGRPWGVDLGRVRAPVALWSGDRDTTHPTSHSRRLAALLGGAPVEVVPGAATFGLLGVFGEVLRFAAGLGDGRARL